MTRLMVQNFIGHRVFTQALKPGSFSTAYVGAEAPTPIRRNAANLRDTTLVTGKNVFLRHPLSRLRLERPEAH